MWEGSWKKDVTHLTFPPLPLDFCEQQQDQRKDAQLPDSKHKLDFGLRTSFPRAVAMARVSTKVMVARNKPVPGSKQHA